MLLATTLPLGVVGLLPELGRAVLPGLGAVRTPSITPRRIGGVAEPELPEPEVSPSTKSSTPPSKFGKMGTGRASCVWMDGRRCGRGVVPELRGDLVPELRGDLVELPGDDDVLVMLSAKDDLGRTPIDDLGSV